MKINRSYKHLEHCKKVVPFIPKTRPIKLGVLGSTRGTTMGLFIDHINQGSGKADGSGNVDGSIKADIAAVISDNKNSYILKRAQKADIRNIYVPPDGELDNAKKLDKCGLLPGLPEYASDMAENRELFDRKVDDIFSTLQVDIILLIGFMRILSSWFCEKWKDRVLNIHPSLLPDFAAGMDMNIHQAVLGRKMNVTGCTVHIVTSKLDAGPILVQKQCQVLPADTPETLKKRVQYLEAKALLEALKLFVITA